MAKDPAAKPPERASPPPPDRLAELRARIDRADDDILALLNARAALVRDVAELKTALDVPFYVPSRERQIADRLAANNPGPFPTEAIRSVFQEIFSACLTLEKRVRVAYLGPEGTFSHMAVKQQFGLSARATPIGTIPGVFEEVARGGADFGVVPVENTTEGGIIHTFDTFLESDLKISAEIALEIHMCLLARAGVDMTQIERVYSIPVAAGQARRWLATHLPRATIVEARSTADGARLAHDDARGAAVGAEIAARLYDLVILGDTPQGTRAADAHAHVRLVMLANDITLRKLVPDELAKGFGFFQSKPATAFSPFAITPDELGDAWRDGRVHLAVRTIYNGAVVGDPNAGEMHFSFFDLVAHIARTRSFAAGTILGSGTVSNVDRARGVSCLVERRALESIDGGQATTPFMSAGDTIAIEMRDATGRDLCGRIEQRVTGAK